MIGYVEAEPLGPGISMVAQLPPPHDLLVTFVLSESPVELLLPMT
jgi:hypothetical protein